MRAGLQLAVLAAIALLQPGCYLSHERELARTDSGFDAARRETGPRTYDGGVLISPCPRDTVNFPACDDGGYQLCAARATAQAAGAYPHSTCLRHGGMPIHATCAAADSCDDGGRCFCNPSRICATTEVCVSDTPDGPTRCVAACSGL